MKIQNAGKVTENKIQAVLNNSELSKSGKMKELFLMGLEIKDIAERVGVRYNFVYNVVSNLVRMNDIEVEKSVKEGKRDQIIALFKAGKTNTEISNELKTNYQYVYKVVKEFKKEQETAAAQVVEEKTAGEE